MDPTFFLTRPQNHISIISWNLNSIKTKIEKSNVSNIINQYDIVSLNEIKTPLSVSYPGYKSIISRDIGNPSRGGTCVLIRNSLSTQVTNIDLSKPDQVWLQLKCQPCILFGFLYIPPHDSPYYNESSFSYIQEKLKGESTANSCFIIGDINARFGQKVKDLLPYLDLPNMSYPVISDPVVNSNTNANLMFSICCDERLLIVNNAKIGNEHFRSNLTYKQGSVWVSEVDICAISPSLVDRLRNFNVFQDLALPSDHAPISVELKMSIDLSMLYDRASYLGDHAVCHTGSNPKICKKPIKYSHINASCFKEKLAQFQVPSVDVDIDTI